MPSIKLRHWPQGAHKIWSSRKRMWPTEDVVEEIVNGGCHLVPKMSPRVPCCDHWRLSFSLPELYLAKARNHGQNLTYFIFKSLYYHKIKCISVEDETLPSYLAKTTMLYACEQTPTDEWTDENLTQNLQMLFLLLQTSLRCGIMFPRNMFPRNC